MKAIQASVIIPSFNGKDKVIGLLKSIEKQTVTNVEVLVVIDGSTDGSADALRSTDWKLQLRLIEQENKGRAGARNTGAGEAQSELLIFFDDDLMLDPACIEKHISANDLSVKRIVMGQVIEPSSAADTEIKKYKDYLNQSWATVLDPYKQKIFPENLTVLSAQNVSITKSIFNTLEGFDSTLKDIEDYDLALRARSKNIPVFYLDTAIAIHVDFFSFYKYALRSKEYFKNRRLAARFNPELYASDKILTHKNSLLQKGVYRILRFPFWLHILDSANIFRFLLPRQVRYKLYGIIITAFAHNQ
jgi:glycosyltransferase involved in cell wall biosynthesis